MISLGVIVSKKLSALSLQVAVETIKDTLDKLPSYPRTQIGFVTFDSTLHFYNLKVGSLQIIFPLHRVVFFRWYCLFICTMISSFCN
jgi:hypothetical protein